MNKPRVRVIAGSHDLVTSDKGYLPVTGGYIPDDWPWNFWQTGRDVMRADGPVATVHACVAAYAETIASLWGDHYAYNPDGSKEKRDASALARILHSPNSYQTRSDFMLNLVRNLLFDGNAYAVGIRNERSEFSSLHIMPSRQTMPYVDPESQSVFYSLGENPMLGEISVMIPARDVFHIKLYSPRHPLVGVSPIENAVTAIASNAAISGQQAAFFRNMSRPSGVLSTEQKLNRDQMTQLRQAWEQQSQGMNSGQIPILGSGIMWEPMGVSSNDAQLVEAFNMTINDIARAFRVPLPMIGQHADGSTYNNVEQLLNHWLSGGLGFLLEHIELSFDKFFGLPRSQFCEFDTESLLRTDFSGKVEGYSKLVQGGLMTVNEGRAKFGGLAPVEFGDTPIIQQQMVPLGSTEPPDEPEPADEPPPALAEPEQDPEEAKGAIIYRIKRAMNQ